MANRKHLKADLSPYTCVLPNCPSPSALYVTKEAWKAHTLTHHAADESWTCFSCPRSFIFKTETHLFEHIRRIHRDTVPTEYIADLVASSKMESAMKISSCPLCPQQDAGSIRADLLDHIAEHLHRFSLLSLPWGVEKGQAYQPHLSNGAAKVKGWLTKYEMSSQEHDIPTFVALRDNPESQYFDKHEYFRDEHSNSTNPDSASDRDIEDLSSWDVHDNDSDTFRHRRIEESEEPSFKTQLDAMFYQAQTGKRFLPRSELERICQRDRVYKQLEQFQTPLYAHKRRSQAEIADCATWICEGRDNERSSREIFVILCLIDRGDLIWDFKAEGIRDSMLPFSRDEEETTLWRTRKRGQKEKDPSHAIKFLSGDGDMLTVRMDFHERQWSVHTPYIGSWKNGEAQHYDLEVGTIMPWSKVGFVISQGGFGSVRMVQIHESHHGFYPSDMKFALKTLYRNDGDPLPFKKDFRLHCLALQALETDSHIVQLCATFNLGDELMMLFPWADGGSLCELWDGGNRQTPAELCQCIRQDSFSVEQGEDGRFGNQTFMHWIADQCLGISTALAAIHNYPQPGIPSWEGKSWRHGNIKPAKILYFSQERDVSPLGKFKLSGFEEAELHEFYSRTVPPGPGPMTQAYRAPEYDLPNEVEISLAADVWSLGCVFTELLTWVVKGPEGVEAYGDERVKELTFPPTATKSIGADDFFCRPEMSGTRSGPRGGERHVAYEGLKRKDSVDRWCEEIIRFGTTAHGRTFLGDFMNFTTTRMMHPWRTDRASSQDVADFLNKCISDWPIDEPGSYWDCNVASKNHQVGQGEVLNGLR